MSTDIVSTKLDGLKIVTLDGEEWSARDLLPLAGYSQWRDWANAIERAKASVTASRLNAADHFVESRKLVETGSGARREIEDYRITRYGAYILFQNADGSKPEIAAVQSYFAVQTRKQEIAPSIPNLGTPQGQLWIAQQLTESAQREIAATERAEKAEQFKAAIERADGLTPRDFHKHYFPAVPEKKLFTFLYTRGILIDQRGKGSRREDGTYRDGTQHGDPSFKGKRWFYIDSGVATNGYRFKQTRVRPGDPELDLAAYLEKNGFQRAENTKEIAA